MLPRVSLPLYCNWCAHVSISLLGLLSAGTVFLPFVSPGSSTGKEVHKWDPCLPHSRTAGSVVLLFWEHPSYSIGQWEFTQVRASKADMAYLRLVSLPLALGKQHLPGFFTESEQGPKAAGSLIQLKFLGCRWHRE